MDAENIDVYVYGYLNTRSAIDFLLEFYTSAVELVWAMVFFRTVSLLSKLRSRAVSCAYI